MVSVGGSDMEIAENMPNMVPDAQARVRISGQSR